MTLVLVGHVITPAHLHTSSQRSLRACSHWPTSTNSFTASSSSCELNSTCSHDRQTTLTMAQRPPVILFVWRWRYPHIWASVVWITWDSD